MPSLSALIIGASRGLGLGLVQEFIDRDWTVTATTRPSSQQGDIEQLALRAAGALQLRSLDLLRPAEVQTIAQGIGDDEFDLLFVTAGVWGPPHQSVLEVTDADFSELLLTNALAPVRAATVLASKVRSKGVIALMTSGLGSIADNTSGGSDLYRASKAALNQLTRSLALSPVGRDRAVLSVNPGWVRTAMGGSSAPLDVETSARGIADVVEGHLGRTGHRFIDYRGEELPW